MVGQEDLPKFRRHKDDRRYFEVPGRFPLNTAYTEVHRCCESLRKLLSLRRILSEFQKGHLKSRGNMLALIRSCHLLTLS